LLLGLIGIATRTIITHTPFVVRVHDIDFRWLGGLDEHLQLLFVLDGPAGPVPISCFVLTLVSIMTVFEAFLASGHS
jgi:hypothetical protein